MKIKSIAKWALVGISVALAVLWAVPAQGATDTHTVTFDNNSAITLTIPETTYGFGDVSPASAATSANDVVNATVKSNAAWSLKIKGSANFISGSNNIAIGRLQWSENNSTPSWTTMTTSDVEVASGSATGETGVTKGMEYKLGLTYDDVVADGYSATITYTATNP